MKEELKEEAKALIDAGKYEQAVYQNLSELVGIYVEQVGE